MSNEYSSAEYNNLDIYQINSTYYSALGDDDVKIAFSARLIQAFAPGIPQVYAGLLAEKNDLRY